MAYNEDSRSLVEFSQYPGLQGGCQYQKPFFVVVVVVIHSKQ